MILRRGYIFHGTLRTARERRLLEKHPEKVGMESIVAAIQNHDFIGNHPAGLRLHQTTSADAQRAAAALLLLSPSIPILFMGEKFASDAPFYFFTDFEDPKIRRAVARGRKAEHPQHDWKNAVSPLSDAAFLDSKIGPTVQNEMLDWYRTLIGIRNDWRSSGFLSSETLSAEWDAEKSTGVLRYLAKEGKDGHFVVIRLHLVKVEPEPVLLKVEGECLMHQDFDPPTGETGSFAVVVGTGSVDLM